MKKIYIIGAGPGNPDLLTMEAKRAISECDCLIGHGRLLALYRDGEKLFFESTSNDAIRGYIEQAKDGTIGILVSGDTGFYSLSKKLAQQLKGLGEVHILSGISALQYFCSRIQSSWDDAVFISLHGRQCNLVEKVRANRKVYALTGGEMTPKAIGAILCKYEMGHVTMTVGENLSYPNEKITTAKAEEVCKLDFSPLCVIQIVNPQPREHHFLHDEGFVRGNTPMTKQEIRCISISKLQLSKQDVVFDIGAGTGSVAVEMALQAPEATVYAIEREAEAVALIQQNQRKFGAANLTLLQGEAQDLIAGLPVPDKAFIGGSGGAILTILDGLYAKNPMMRIVINAVTLETLCEITGYYKDREEYLVEVVNLSVTNTKRAGKYHMFTGQNPVYIITVSRRDG